MNDIPESVTITSVGDGVPDDWDDLVRACPWGSFYHGRVHLELLQSVSPATVHCLTVRGRGARLAGGVAFGVQDGALGPVVNCLPYFGSYGDALVHPEAPGETEALVYTSLLEECRRRDAFGLSVISSPFGDATHHARVKELLQPTFVDERCCQITPLPDPAGTSAEGYREELLRAIEGRARTAYRKVLKAGLHVGRVETEREALEFARIHEANIGGKGGVFKTETFFRQAFALSQRDPERAELAVMRDGDKVVAGTVLFHWNGHVEYHTTCLRDEYRSLGPLTQIVVERMAQAGMAGRRYWNFGGTWKSQEGVYKFKQSFGARDYPYFYFTRFLRPHDRLLRMTPAEIVQAYPLCFVIPFSQLRPQTA